MKKCLCCDDPTCTEAHAILSAPFATLEVYEEAKKATLCRASDNMQRLVANLPYPHCASALLSLAEQQKAEAT